MEVELVKGKAKGTVIELSPEDLDLLEPRAWTMVYKGKNAYFIRSTGGRGAPLEYLHIVIASRFMNVSSKLHVDHIDRNTLNNQRNNLRLVSAADNVQNQGLQRVNTSGYMGVCFDRARSKWKAEIRVHTKRHYLGRFDSAIEAAKAYDLAIERLGSQSPTNLSLGLYEA